MRRAVISSENPLWQNVIGVLAFVTLTPLVIVLKLVTMPFERPAKRTADEVVQYLRDFIDGTGGEWDFDDFSCIPIADPRLDSIRERASRFNGPSDEDALAELKALLSEARKIAADEGGGTT